jgi:uncharacterized membrane protein YkgB
VKRTFDRIDRSIAAFMRRWGTNAIRFSFAVIFIWFGLLKPLGLSSAAPLVRSTVEWMPFFSADTWVSIIGWWEVAIGVTFMFHRSLRIAIALLAMQMVGTFLPLFVARHITFQPGGFPYAPTMEGQYIIKNLMIISGAMVVGGTVRQKNHP